MCNSWALTSVALLLPRHVHGTAHVPDEIRHNSIFRTEVPPILLVTPMIPITHDPWLKREFRSILEQLIITAIECFKISSVLHMRDYYTIQQH
jgi:hypothetical protein